MKNDKKGFTLIELLAVIVILAIIILIAVNVIIPLINKSKKKSFIDEANVYINGAMNHRAIDTDSGTADSTCVTIEELNQEYIKKHSSNYSGVVKIDNVDGELVPTIYLTNGKYYVVGGNNITTSNVTTEEPDVFFSSCPEPKPMELGDIVKIGRDEFIFLEKSDDEIKLLSKYGLDSNNRQSDTPRRFIWSNGKYWNNNSNFKPFGDSSYKYVYRTKDNEDVTELYYITPAINAYKEYLDGLNIINIIDARLMSYEEATATGCKTSIGNSCPTYIADMDLWLGSVRDNEGSGVWYIKQKQRTINGYPYNNFDASFAVKPLIIVSKNITFTGSGTADDPYVITG